MKKIVITGAGGFLGTALLQRLAAQADVEVTAFTFDFERERETFVRAENIVPLDNSEAADFDYSQTDVLINCAFPRNAESAVIANGLSFIADVIRKAAADKIGSLINISSQSVYNPMREKPASEEDALYLETKYAVGKYASELLTNTLCADIPHTNIRMASLIGPAFDQRVTNKMVTAALETGKLRIVDNQQYFGYIDIEDAVSGILSLLTIPASGWHAVYNLGDTRTYTLKDIAETIVSVFRSEQGKQIEIEVAADDKILNSALDGALLRNHTGFAPGITLEESISRILAYKLKH